MTQIERHAFDWRNSKINGCLKKRFILAGGVNSDESRLYEMNDSIRETGGGSFPGIQVKDSGG